MTRKFLVAVRVAHSVRVTCVVERNPETVRSAGHRCGVRSDNGQLKTMWRNTVTDRVESDDVSRDGLSTICDDDRDQLPEPGCSLTSTTAQLMSAIACLPPSLRSSIIDNEVKNLNAYYDVD